MVEVRGQWREPVNLYTVTALPPGARKSAVFAEMTMPVIDTEPALVDGTHAARSSKPRRSARSPAKTRTRPLRRPRASGTRTSGRTLADAIAQAKLAEAVTVPVMPQLVADDITAEAATSLLAEQDGRLAVLSAEGGIFATLAGRYSSGVPNFEVFLKGHSGDMLRVNRKGRPPEYVRRPALTLGLCVQPEVLRDIAELPGFRGRGLLARILYSMPPDLVGHRQIGEAGIPEDVRGTYAANVQALVRSLAEWTDPAVLTLTPAAAAVLLDAEKTIEPRLELDTGDLAGIRDWAAKQIGATARIAGLLHLGTHLRDGWGRAIDASTMAAALDIGGYYTEHALAAFDHMGTDPVIETARVVLRWIEREQPERFTRREAHMGLSRSRFPKVTDLDAPLGLLEDHGYIRREPEPEGRWALVGDRLPVLRPGASRIGR